MKHLSYFGVFLVLLFTLTPWNQAHSQSEFSCGTDHSGPIKKYSPRNNYNEPVEIRVAFWNMCKDDGSGGMDQMALENHIEEVKLDFNENYNIEIRDCIRQNNSTNQYSADKWSEGDVPVACNSINFYFYSTGSNFFVGGQAELGGISGYSKSLLKFVTMHELGHIFDLRHTFSTCSENPGSVLQPNCNDVIDCEDAGDGICDTPPHIVDTSGESLCTNSLFRTSSGFQNFFDERDACGVLFHDDEDVLLKNYMNYNNSCCSVEFTADQKEHMLNHILAEKSEFLGNFDECIDFQTIEYDQVYENYNGELNLGSIQNKQLTFTNSQINVSGKLRLTNSTLILNNCIITSGCSGDFRGIDLIKNSNLVLKNGSDIPDAVSILGENCYLSCSNSKISTLYPGVTHAINSISDSYIVIKDNSVITGTVSIIGDGTSDFINGTTDIYNNSTSALSYFSLRDSEINALDIEGIALETYDAFVDISDSRVHGSWTGLSTTNGIISVNGSSIYDNLYSEVSFSNPEQLSIVNNYLYGINMYAINPIVYDISNNEFSDCTGACTNNDALRINSSNDIANRINNNFIDVPRKGLRSDGDQTRLKYLCNEFKLAETYNFDWDGVDPFQGEDFNVASGNIFSSSTSNQLKGNSTNITYQFYDANPDEVLNNYTNAGINPIPVLISATGCDQIGPSFIPGGGTGGGVTTGPGPDIVDGCPIGINCTLPCPKGIDCTQNCPPGINCLTNCPPGIDCTQPCPRGINCFEACPPGMDCTTTNPINPEIFVEVDCSTDPILTHIASQYENIKRQIEVTKSGKQIKTIAEHISSNLNTWKESLLTRVQNKEISYSQGFLEDIFSNSKLFTEKEVTQIIVSNPECLFDNRLAKVIFETNSFSQKNITKIQNARNTWLNSPDASKFLNRYKLEENLSKISRYALKRLGHSLYQSIKCDNEWYARLNTPSANYQIVDNLYKLGDFREMTQKINDIRTSNTIELNDLYNYQKIMNVLIDVRRSDLSLFELDKSQIETLEEIAHAKYRYSSTKAMGILRTFYDYKFPKVEFVELKPKALSFLNQSTPIVYRDIASEKTSIFPTVSSGKFTVISPNTNSIKHIEIYNQGGGLVKRIQFDNEKLEFTVNLSNGIYFYTISTVTGILKQGKLIITK